MEMQTELQSYIKIMQRRKWEFFVPTATIMAICLLVTFLLPPVYESTSVILIETQDVPQDLVQSTVTGLVEERLQGLNQVVLSRSRLLEMINRFDLYPGDRDLLGVSELVDNMRNDISIDMIQTEVNDPDRARSGMATYAFSLTFEGQNPAKVQQVTNTLTSLYLEENIKNREGKAQSTYDYLESRIADVEADIDDVQERIAAFKAEHKYTLPELTPVNMTSMERLEPRISFREDEVKKKLEQIRYWEGKRAATPKFIIVRTTGGQRLITPEEELDRMRRDYIALLATRSKDHPDAMNLKNEIDALEQQVKHRQDLKAYQDLLEDKENELATAQDKFSGQHPDVRRLTREVAGLQEDIKTLEERYSILAKKEDKEINPAWVHADQEMENKKIELVPLQTTLKALYEQQAELQQRIDEAPQVELAYNSLLHEMASLTTAHDELLERTLSAREAKGLEESGLGEKFTLIDPPLLPEKPARPNRPLLLAMGLIASVAIGSAFGIFSEYLDRSVHAAQDLASLTHLPVLAVIPYLETSGERSRKVDKKKITYLGGAAAVILGLLLFHFLIMPIDVLVYRILNKLQAIL